MDHCFRSNEELIKYLKRCGKIKSDEVYNAMKSVDRKHFVPISTLNAYKDKPLPIEHGKTISAPHMHAHILELFSSKLGRRDRVLDIGFGSGYLTTCMALMQDDSGLVVGIECIPQFKQITKNIISRHYPSVNSSTRMKLMIGDGRLGYASKGPYDFIYVGAAAKTVPQTLIDQLAIGGRLIMPIIQQDISYQRLYQIDKMDDGDIQRKPLMMVRFGFLTHAKNHSTVDKDSTEHLNEKNKESEDGIINVIDDMKYYVQLFYQQNDRKNKILNKTAIEKINEEIKIMKNSLTAQTNKDNNERDKFTTNFEHLSLQQNATENKLLMITKKMDELEKILTDKASDNTTCDMIKLLPTNMFKVFENAIKIQNSIIDAKKDEINSKDKKLQEMQEKIEYIEKCFDVLTTERETNLKSIKEALDRELRNKKLLMQSMEGRLEALEEKITTIQTQTEMQPSIVSLMDKILEIQNQTLKNDKMEKSTINKTIVDAEKWEEMQVRIGNLDERQVPEVNDKFKKRIEDVIDQEKDNLIDKIRDVLETCIRELEVELSVYKNL